MNGYKCCVHFLLFAAIWKVEFPFSPKNQYRNKCCNKNIIWSLLWNIRETLLWAVLISATLINFIRSINLDIESLFLRILVSVLDRLSELEVGNPFQFPGMGVHFCLEYPLPPTTTTTGRRKSRRGRVKYTTINRFGMWLGYSRVINTFSLVIWLVLH